MGIQRYLGENYGSIISIDYVPARYVTMFNPARRNIAAGNIQFATGKGWQNIYCTQDTMGHRQQQSRDANGSAWSQTVVGFVPGDEDQIEAGLGDIHGDQRYIVRVTRPNGVIKIIGSPAEPLDADVDSNSQINVPGRAGTAITFTGKTIKRALTYIV